MAETRPPVTDEEVRAAYLATGSIHRAAAAVGRSKATVAQRLRKMGVPTGYTPTEAPLTETAAFRMTPEEKAWLDRKAATCGHPNTATYLRARALDGYVPDAQ